MLVGDLASTPVITPPMTGLPNPKAIPWALKPGLGLFVLFLVVLALLVPVELTALLLMLSILLPLIELVRWGRLLMEALVCRIGWLCCCCGDAVVDGVVVVTEEA